MEYVDFGSVMERHEGLGEFAIAFSASFLCSARSNLGLRRGVAGQHYAPGSCVWMYRGFGEMDFIFEREMLELMLRSFRLGFLATNVSYGLMMYCNSSCMR